MTTLTRYLDPTADNERWNRFEPRPGDIIVSTPPKAGTTLVQMLCALLIFDGPEFPDTLGALSPWFDMLTTSDDAVLALVEAQTHRRVLKTHTPLDGIPRFDDVTFISVARDPRDIFISWEHQQANIDPTRVRAATANAGNADMAESRIARQDASLGRPRVPRGLEHLQMRFDQWLGQTWEHWPCSLARIVRHASVARTREQDPHVLVLHYEEVRADLAQAGNQIATIAGFDGSESHIAMLSAHAGFDAMRARAAELAPNQQLLESPTAFFRSGSVGDWQAALSTTELAAYDARLADMVDPSLRAWLERP